MVKKSGRKKQTGSKSGISDSESVEILPAEETTNEPENAEIVAESSEIQPDIPESLDDIEIEAESLEEEKKKLSALTTYDPLRAYLSELSQYPKLTKEEEHELAVRYKKDGDLKAAYQLTVGNLWLVVAIARRYQRAARSLLDLIQEGNIGLMDAVRNFDPYRDVRFPSYASWWIKAYIIRYVIANWRLVKIGTTQAQRKLFFNLEKEREKLERQGFIPTSKLLAANLNVKESEVIEMQQRLGGSDVSVDAPLSMEEESANLHSLLPSDAPTAEDTMAAQEIKEQIAKAMSDFSATLNDKERAIFERRLLSEDKATLQDIAEEFSLSKERIRQLENRIKEKLKEFVKKELGDAFLHSDLGIE